MRHGTTCLLGEPVREPSRDDGVTHVRLVSLLGLCLSLEEER